MADSEATYFVEVGGQRLGLASLDMLRQWRAEGRITPDTILFDATTQRQVTAREVPGLFDATAAAGPPPVQGWQGQMPPPGYATGPAPRQGWPVWAVLLCVFGGLCVVCVPISAAILFPVFSQAKYAAKKTLGLSHMKELGLSAVIYTNDYDDHFPPNMASALGAKPYLIPCAPRGTDISQEALFESLNPSGGSILGDERLNGQSVNELSSPSTAVVFYDEKPWPHGEGLACYADGHARSHPSFDEIAQELKVDPIVRDTGGSKSL